MCCACEVDMAGWLAAYQERASGGGGGGEVRGGRGLQQLARLGQAVPPLDALSIIAQSEARGGGGGAHDQKVTAPCTGASVADSAARVKRDSVNKSSDGPVTHLEDADALPDALVVVARAGSACVRDERTGKERGRGGGRKGKEIVRWGDPHALAVHGCRTHECRASCSGVRRRLGLRHTQHTCSFKGWSW